MTGHDAMDRAVLDWMVEQERHPAYLGEILAVTSNTRRRARWTFPGWWLPACGSLPDRRLRIAIVVALLLAALVGTILAIGSLRREVPLLGQNGAIAFRSTESTMGAGSVVEPPVQGQVRIKPLSCSGPACG
jgi:hypothetical protein